MVSKLLHAAIAALLIGLQAQGATHFIWAGATGLGNGSSMANAWTSPAAMNWSVVNPGDTIVISGGPSGIDYYPNGFTFQKSGITVVHAGLAYGAEHSGTAYLPSLSFGSTTNNFWNGFRIPGFVPRDTLFSHATGTNLLLRENIPNMGLFITRSNAVSASPLVQFSGAGGIRNRIWFTQMVGNTNATTDVHGVRFLNMTSLEDCEIAYSRIAFIQNDGINQNSGPQKTSFNGLTVRSTIIEQTGDDGIQWSRNGLTLVNVALIDHWTRYYNGHPDQLQLAGDAWGYIKSVNCLYMNKGNSLIIGEHLVREGSTIGPFIFVGNLFQNTPDFSLNAAQAYGATFVAWRPNADVNVGSATWDGFLFANNLMANQRTTPLKFGKASITGGTKSVTNLFLRNWVHVNNLLVNNKYNAPSAWASYEAGGIGDPGASAQGVFFDEPDFVFDRNVVTRGANGNTRIYYHGTLHETGEAFNATEIYTGNSSAMPGFVSTNNLDWRLLSTDTVARNKGASLSAYTNAHPEIRFDAWGVDRFADGQTDIGPSEFIATIPEATPNVKDGLGLHITFEDEWAATGSAADYSGANRHALRFGRQTSPTNFPAAITYTNVVAGKQSIGGLFRNYARDGWGVGVGGFNKSGDYMAVTNVSGGISTTNAITVAAYVEPRIGGDQDNNGVADWHEAQGRIISGGYGKKGSWAMGMFAEKGINWMMLRVYLQDSADSDVYLSFGEATRIAANGAREGQFQDAQGMHLGFTVENATVRLYTNGVLVGSPQVFPSLTNIVTAVGPGAQVGTGYIGIGVDTHNGRPWMTPHDDSGDQYPNNGFFAGIIDDVRVHWGRALTANQMRAIATWTAPEPEPVIPPPVYGTGITVGGEFTVGRIGP
ncbi:MAG TPA: hypothetical protein VK146_05080 [Tabrizicola sp.]|nr:hypothetical protein [Tabrizicola sp.]